MPPFTQDQTKAKIRELIARYDALSDTDRKVTTEASVVHQFIDPLLQALGWPIQDPARYKYELNTQAGRPDMTLLPEQGGTIFVEAKRFGAIQELAQARKTIAGIVTPGQLALPGMATDRTQQEQQAINYAFQNGGMWAILTNFEKLRLFNARRDWLVLSFENPRAYLDEFDLLWQLSYESVCSGQLDLLSNQRHREDVDTDYLNFINEWREKLAQDIIAHPNDNPWAFHPDGRMNLAQLRAVVQRVLDRLVVVRFAEDHLIAPVGTLYSFYEMRQRNPYTFTLGEFFARLYRRFDELHNSALFAPNQADRAVFSDAVLSGLIQKLYEARYRAMSADIMGNTYEQYLGKTLVQVNGHVQTADNLETRKKQGSYYTPQVIVRYLVDNSLGRYLYGTANGQPDGDPLPDATRKTAADIKDLHVLDPACGSGSFLIYAYQVLADFYRSEIKRLETERRRREQELIGQGVTTPFDLRMELTPWTAEIERLQNFPNLILETHLYGVDLDPQAAEIATVNLIMRAMADQRGPQKRLPLILNQNIKVGNALIGCGPNDPRYTGHAADLAELRRLRRKLPTETNDAGHAATIQAIEEISRRVTAALNEDLTQHFDDPAAHRPFHWAAEFPELFVDEQGQSKGEAAGFEVVIGNPPWEIVKPDLREYYAQFDPEIEGKLTRRQVEARIKELNADPKIEAGWQAQIARIEAEAAYYKNTGDYVYQGRGDLNTYKLFTERGISLLTSFGRLSVIIPSGIYRDLGTKELRETLLENGAIEYLYCFANGRGIFPDIHKQYRFVLIGWQKGVSLPDFPVLFRITVAETVTTEEMRQVLHDPSIPIRIKPTMLRRFSPDSLSLTEFRTQQDVEIAEKIFNDWSLLGDAVEGWAVKFWREFDLTNARKLFNQNRSGLPLYEGKMIHQFTSFFAEPRFWIEENKGRDYLLRSQDDKNQTLLYQRCRLGYRDVANKNNARTLIAAVLPPNVFAGNTVILETETSDKRMLYLLSVLNSFILDFIIRYKVDAHVSMFYAYQLPLPRLTEGNPYFDAIVPRAACLTCTTPDFADLWQEVMGEPWDESKGATNPTGRQTLRDELDAFVAHLYGLNRDDFAHILGTFPLVFPDDDAGRAKKEALLSVFDRFAEITNDWPQK